MDSDRKRRATASPEPRASDAPTPSPDHATDLSKGIRDLAKVAAGYIVGERPALLRRDGYISVINNQKCTLYDCKEANKLYDTDTQTDMIVSCDSYAYNEDIDLLFTASYDGILKIYIVKSHEKELPQNALLATFHICPKGLLSVKVSKATGDLIFVYIANDSYSETVVTRMTIDYDTLIHTEEDFDVNIPIVLQYSIGVGNAKENGKEDVGGDNTNIAKRGKCDVNLPIEATENGTNRQVHGNTDALCKEFVKEVKPLCSLPSRVDVFATDTDLRAIAFAIGKTAIVLNMVKNRIVFFECFASISCMAFFTADSFAVGDSRGRISVYNIDLSTEAQTADNLVVACDIPQDKFELNASYLKKILLAFHSSLANPGDIRDSKEFRKFKKITSSVNTLIWHAHGVNCLSFNSDGTMLLSGGEEGVLVIWYLNSGAKKFVTRIGSAIFHILCQREHGMYILCCEANEILFVDPFALCIRKRVAGVTVAINIGTKVNKEINALSLPDNETSRVIMPVGNADINKAHVCMTVVGDPTIPLIQHWPTNLTESLTQSNGDNEVIVGGNVAIYARSNKLQIYNYIHDREVGSLLLKNVNILSRQDDEFGQDWYLEELLISNDGFVVVTVQSRNVLNNLSTTNERGTTSVLPEFEHEVLTNNRKGLIKFWIKQKGGESDGYVMGNYIEHTKISNPHSHKTTSIRQISDKYAFITTSLDSEFKLWNMIRKRILKSDNVFETYKSLDINDSDYQVDITDPESYMWVCVAVGSYKNMPCYASAITDAGRLLAISHDVVVTFWKVSISQTTVDLVGAVPLPNDEKPNVADEIRQESGAYQHLTFLYPNQPRLLIYSKRSKLCVLDFIRGETLWNYPIARGQVVDRIVHSPQMPNLLVVSSSCVDEASFGCYGILEMFWLKYDQKEGLAVEQFYRAKREISRVVLNMCLSPAAFGYNRHNKRSDKVAPIVPVLSQNALVSTLVLLTANLNLETVIIMSDLYGVEKPKVIDISNLPCQQSLPRKALKLTRSHQFDLITQLIAVSKAAREASGAKKRVKFNISDQLCKSSELRYRVKHPLPKSVLDVVVDPGCPTSALPPPNVILNRLLHLVTIKHERQN
ncbi:wd repeat-containing protein 75 [Babesia gibsoni]|uniref:Wd repeat-containing protein 75 n=1 Tax=Babesia gibsoni TaxID=33632 RepID=A0AAD8LMC0_BABGI|nr:wd repeat-containing protein 75 [Babesia gibsoni]